MILLKWLNDLPYVCKQTRWLMCRQSTWSEDREWAKVKNQETNWEALAMIQRKMMAAWTRDIMEQVVRICWIWVIFWNDNTQYLLDVEYVGKTKCLGWL